MKFQLQQLQEMLDNTLNHTSIFTWGWFNEGPSDDSRACPAYGACSDYSRTRDPTRTRFTAWADDKDLNGVCYEHASLIDFNNYPGWYLYGKKTPSDPHKKHLSKTFIKDHYIYDIQTIESCVCVCYYRTCIGHEVRSQITRSK